ncbi:putative sporulation protein YyaC [Caloramator quimbayensis]|uniref:Putative sporulation protein YyaC n=1 Tax=Caloramator quimbayensis TaxID=1147123 RepID=A0A1T4Y6S8_9CLOT|nr:spore protease YyaC [Caloramator quimbayensis]SKA97489.1 putative sporulation protein YyaC [Caloramator quimbayensis]
MLKSQPLYFSIDSCKPEAVFLISKELSSLIINREKDLQNIIILCIGTDRSTGDCLGPLVGDKLSKIIKKPYIHIFGTLKEPVHAKNLETKTKDIYSYYNNPLIIAVDASLGKSENIGKINIFNGPLFPGAGVNKNLISVGDISITGIVNISGFMEYVVLQSTRLSLVMQLADTISLSIFSALKNINNKIKYFSENG